MVWIDYKKLMFATVIFFTQFLADFARAEVLFEGFSKVMSGGVHIGYAINRYEFDAKKKEVYLNQFFKNW